MIFDLDPDDIDFDNLDPVRKTFMLIFTTVIWRRVWITASVYAEHNSVNITKTTVLKSIKYNVYSTSGIGESFKICIKKALSDGYVMPNTYDDKYIKTAIDMFKEGYNVVVRNNDMEIGLFTANYALSIFKPDNSDKKININEQTDIIAMINKLSDREKSLKYKPITIDKNVVCGCGLCVLVNNWDINDNLLYSQDSYKNVIFKDMIKSLEAY